VCIDWLRAKAEAVEGSAAARAAGKQVRVLRTSPEAATDLAAALSKRGIQQQQKKAQQQQEQEQQQAGGRGAKKQRTGVQAASAVAQEPLLAPLLVRPVRVRVAKEHPDFVY
jgi:hypothetical protein